MNFSGIFNIKEVEDLINRSGQTTHDDVRAVLGGRTQSPEDFAALISDPAMELRETLAVRAKTITERRFGKVIQMYIPLYLSSECVNSCRYCGYRQDLQIARKSLTPDEAVQEAEKIRSMGFGHILLLTGGGYQGSNLEYLEESIRKIRKIFPSVSLEVETRTVEEYSRLHLAGAEGVTVYQETYHPVVYQEMHPRGPKRDYVDRLDAPDRIGQAGFRKLNIGALLGLHDWRFEALSLMLHLKHLMKRYWQAQLSVSFPRITNHPEDFKYFPVRDKELVQMVMAFRICFPDVNIVISTRERHDFRMNLLRLGVTQMSAGSRTNPGGYGLTKDGPGQFEPEDNTSPVEMAHELSTMGYEPVWKDWDSTML